MVTPRTGRVETDVCIVGGGPVGLSLAESLADRGVEVVVLESGEGEGPLDPVEPDLHLDGGVVAEGFDPLWQSRARGVGGTSRIWNTIVGDAWTAKYAALDPIDYEARPDVAHTGWPLSAETLAPFLTRASTTCEIDPAIWQARGDPDVQLDGLTARAFAFGGRARFTDELPSRLRDDRRVRLRTGATVTALVVGDGGRRVDEVRWAGTDGQNGSVAALRVVLAGGAIENARLLLATACPEAGWTDSPWLGLGFMEHPVDRSLELVTRSPLLTPDAGFFQPHLLAPRHAEGDRVDDHSGWCTGRLCLPSELLRNESLPNLSVRFTTQEAGAAVLEAPQARTWARRLLPSSALRRRVGDVVRAGARLARRAGGLTYRLQVDLEQWPDPANRVTLAGRGTDQQLPPIQLEWRWSPADEARRDRLLRHLTSALEGSGLGKVQRTTPLAVDPNSHHHAGTTRMHSDPAQGVVDPDLKVHGTDNLFVCGASTFPTAGVVNPTLTAIALAHRLTDHLCADADGLRR